MIRSAMNDIPEDRWDLAFPKEKERDTVDQLRTLETDSVLWQKGYESAQTLSRIHLLEIRKHIIAFYNEFPKAEGLHDYPADYVDEAFDRILKLTI